jgi:hypothetical protein
MVFFILLISLTFVSAGLDLFIQEYKEDTYYSMINIVNNGQLTYHDLQLRIDDGGWEHLAKVIDAGTGYAISKTITPGQHTFEITTKEGYTYKENLNFAISANTAAKSALSGGQTEKELDASLEKEKRFAQIREEIIKKRESEQRAQEMNQENESVVFRKSVSVNIFVIMSIVLVLLLAVLAFVFVRRKKNV